LSYVRDGIDGKDPIVLIVENSNGNIFINGDIDTLLTVKALQGNEDITNHFDQEAFVWSKYDENGILDTSWSRTGT
jgi:hypothetical protein